MKQALDLGHLRVAIPLARKCIYRCYIFEGTCLMYRIGLKPMNSSQYPSTIDKDVTRDMNETLLSLRCLRATCQA